ncbi:MAG: biotin carboxylase N-terminal domain-containing protein [Gammaproteobacteria bacterium]|nr:biotin carboxylase N-terminal domain-containing protein [Gammaproteobacteria bacterium]
MRTCRATRRRRRWRCIPMPTRDALHVRSVDHGRAHRSRTGARQLPERRAHHRRGPSTPAAEAVHPGYGFLSENADLARACDEDGLVFIGPSPRAIEAMGSKIDAKRLMEKPAIPLVPGYHGADQAAEHLSRSATEHRFSAAHQGLRRRRRQRHAAWCARPKAFETALDGAQARVRLGVRRRPGAAGDVISTIARHVEMQVFRRSPWQLRAPVRARLLHPAPPPEDHRGGPRARASTERPASAMGEAAVRAARRHRLPRRRHGRVHRANRRHGGFYFMEMNTRLQVEHPVTEAITGLDLVEWQLRIAAG